MRSNVDLPLPLQPSTIQRWSGSTIQSTSARIARPSSIRVTRIISIAGGWLRKAEGAPHGTLAVGLGDAPSIAEATDERRTTVAPRELVPAVRAGRRSVADFDSDVIVEPLDAHSHGGVGVLHRVGDQLARRQGGRADDVAAGQALVQSGSNEPASDPRAPAGCGETHLDTCVATSDAHGSTSLPPGRCSDKPTLMRQTCGD